MAKPRLGVDIDGVICCLLPRLLEKLKEDYNIHIEEKEINQFDLSEQFGFSQSAIAEILQVSSFYKELPTVSGASFGLTSLQKRFDIIYITARNDVHAFVTKQWIYRNGFPLGDVFCSARDKGSFAKKLGINLFIDDRYKNVIELSEECYKVYLYDRSYNSGRNLPRNICRVKDWNELTFLLNLDYTNGEVGR